MIDHAWLNKVDFEQIREYVGDHPALAEKCPVRKFRQLLWDVVGCETALGDWQQFTSEEQRLIVYASVYGLQAPEKVPYQKGYDLQIDDHEVIPTDINFEYHTQYLAENSYKMSKDEGEPEPVISPPPPTEPELEDPIVFDPKVTGIWDHLLGLMTDEQKARLREQAKKEGATMVLVSAQVEAELVDLDAEDRADFLESLGVKLDDTGLRRVIREAYSILNLQTYFTSGPTETRAWTIQKGWKAPQAAGVIHGDFERGFIKAETITYDDLVTCGSEAEVKKQGKLRLEGKDYVVAEGDVILFRFNV